MSKPSRNHGNPLRQATGLPTPKTMIPHSSAWFEALLEINVRQAHMTQALIQRAGSPDCCTFCGELPAPIFTQARLPNLTARLCTDCLSIRAKLYGESWERNDAPHSPTN